MADTVDQKKLEKWETQKKRSTAASSVCPFPLNLKTLWKDVLNVLSELFYIASRLRVILIVLNVILFFFVADSVQSNKGKVQ